MRRWLTDAMESARQVSDHPALWLPGALAWAVTLGWIPLLVAVARPPSVADLTFVGARMYTSGTWPWNAFAVGGAALAVIGVAVALHAAAEAALLSVPGRRAASAADVARLVGVALVTSVPTLVAMLVVILALALVAPVEFTAPDAGGGALLRTAGRLAPFLAVVVIAWTVGAALHAVAVRLVLRGSHGLIGALGRAPRALARGGAGAWLHPLAILLARAAYLVIAGLLLAVLWAPIRARLAGDGFDAAVILLLVGFVAIWLCLVLGGGALHAWGSVTWTRLLGGPRTHGEAYRP